MRIGIFTNTYKPEINGVVRSITTFRDELVQQGHAVYIFAPEAPKFEDEDYGVFRYPALRLSAKVNYPMAIPVSPYIDWVVPRLKLDILHSNHPVLLGEEAINFAKRLNLPHIFTHHTQYEAYSHYVPFNQTIVRTLTREFVRNYIARSVRVIAPTESMREIIAANYPNFDSRLRVLPSPVNLAHFQSDSDAAQRIRKKYQLGEHFVFVSVSRLTAEKNVSALIEAFAKVHAKNPDTHLLLVGDGALKSDLQHLSSRLNIAEAVIFTGSVPYDEVPHLLSASDVFAFASTTETQGLVTLEAMSVGLPVVVVDAAGNRDVTEDGVNGLLVEKSTDAIAEGMTRLLKDKTLRHELSIGARKTAHSYSAPALTRKLVEIYQEAIERYFDNPIEYKRFPHVADDFRQFPPHWLSEITGGAEWLESVVSFWKNLGS